MEQINTIKPESNEALLRSKIARGLRRGFNLGLVLLAAGCTREGCSGPAVDITGGSDNYSAHDSGHKIDVSAPSSALDAREKEDNASEGLIKEDDGSNHWHLDLK